MTVSQFRRALDALQISSLGRLWLVEPEVDALIALYKDSDDPNRVCWCTFEDDINHGTLPIYYDQIYKIFNILKYFFTLIIIETVELYDNKQKTFS